MALVMAMAMTGAGFERRIALKARTRARVRAMLRGLIGATRDDGAGLGLGNSLVPRAMKAPS